MDINIVIGNVQDGDEVIFDGEIPISMSETWLPDILVKLGLWKSKSQIRRDRPDLCFEIPIGFLTFDDEVERRIHSNCIFKSLGKKKQSLFILRRV